jgi:MYXO-CTERM domain-containing protein
MPRMALSRFAPLTALAIVAIPGVATAMDVQPSDSASSLAQALLTNQQFTLESSTYFGAAGSAGLFTAGPMGIGSGAVLTTGLATSVLPPNDQPATTTDHGVSGAGHCDMLLAASAFDPAVLHFEVAFPNTFDALRIPVVFASEEYPETMTRNPSDVGAIFVNGALVGTFDATSLSQAAVYGAATESEFDAAVGFVVDAPSIVGTNVVDVILCDGGDGTFDSALFVGEIQPCYDGVCGTIGPCGIVDFDFDGESACSDCDDLDASINSLGVEVCNGKDDDCDGAVDGPFGVGVGCSVGVGACARTGHVACVDAVSAACDATPGGAELELCGDSIDSDCDGFIDPISGCGSSTSTGGASGVGGASGDGGNEVGGGGAETTGGAASAGGAGQLGGAAPSGGAQASGGARASGGAAGTGGQDTGGAGVGGDDGLNGISVPGEKELAAGCSCDLTESPTQRASWGAFAVMALGALRRRRQKR